MEISPNGLQFIANNEGFRSKPYTDTGGVWTIGYGTTISDKVAGLYRDGINETLAQSWLLSHVQTFEPVLNKLFSNLLQHQFDALCDLIYNVGLSGFQNSVLYQRLLRLDPSISQLWLSLAIHDAAGHQLVGLIRRRYREAKLFIYGAYH